VGGKTAAIVLAFLVERGIQYWGKKNFRMFCSLTLLSVTLTMTMTKI
jgi:hypothetical protein